MKILHRQLLTLSLLTLTLSGFGQAESQNYSDIDRNRIDSLIAIIDKRNPPKIELDFTMSLDSLVGERIVIVEKQICKTLCKYTIRTNRYESRMTIKFIEIYLCDDSLIRAAVYYDTDKSDFWKMFYYQDNTYFSMMWSPRCMRVSLDDNGQEYVAIAKKLGKVPDHK